MLVLVSINHKHLVPRGRVQIRARYLSSLIQKKISVRLRGRAVNPGPTSLVPFVLRLPGFAGTATRSRLAHKTPVGHLQVAQAEVSQHQAAPKFLEESASP